MGDFIWGFDGKPRSQEQIDQQNRLADALSQNQQPVNSWTQGLSNMVNGLLSGFERGSAAKESDDNEEYSSNLIKGLLGSAEQSGAASASAQADTTPSPVQQIATNLSQPNSQPLTVGQAAGQGAKDLIAQHFVDQMRQAESGGDNNAKNPLSSATGPFQFTNGTWNGLMQQHPELGLTADGRTDPQQSEAAAKQLASDNIAYLLSKGVQNPTDGQAYLAHFAGAPTAANLIQASPNTPVSSIMSPQQIAANPFLRGMTAGGVQNWANTQMGATASAPPQQQAVQIPAQQTPSYQLPAGPSMGAVLNVLADPRANQQAKGIAGAMLQNQLQLQQVAQRYQMEQADPENVARRRYYDAETQRITNQPQQQQGPEFNLLSPQQAQKMGLDPSKSYQMDGTGKITQIGNSGVNVTLNNGPTTSEFQKKSDDEAATRIGGYITEGAQAPALIGQLQQLSDLSRSIGTGKGAQFMAAVGPYAQALGVNVKGLDQQQAFTAIVNRMIPAMRPVGSGSSSDTDVRMFMNSLPQLGNTDWGNQIIAGTMQALQQNKVQAADIAAQAQRGQISWQDAESQIRKLPNPYEQFKKAHSDLVSPSPAAMQQQSGTRTTSNGVSWSVR